MTTVRVLSNDRPVSEVAMGTIRSRDGSASVSTFAECQSSHRPQSRRFGTGVVGLVVVALSIIATGGCGLFGGAPAPSRAELIVLGDVSPSGLALADEQRRHLVDVVVPLAIERRAEVVLARIDDAAFAAPEIVARVGFDTAAAGGN